MAAKLPPFFTKVQGSLHMTREGAKQLKKYTDRAENIWFTMKPNSKIKAKLQGDIKNLKAKCGFADQSSFTNHHIIPGNTIAEMVSKAMYEDRRALSAINIYINSRKGIYEELQSLVKIGDEKQAIAQVFSSIYWNQYNLVLGPGQASRNSDPGQKFDHEVFGIQPQAVKNAYDLINKQLNLKKYEQALQLFLKKRVLCNGLWKKSQGKIKGWNLFPSNPPIYPATAGFAYDIWPWQ